MRVLLVAVLLALTACAPEHQVLGRVYDLQVPKGAADSEPLPLLLLAHGYSVNGFIQNLPFPFSEQVDAKRFRYARLNGTQDAKGKRFWNANESCCNDGRVPVDDVAFFRALVADITGRYATTRVFLVGHSNGGAMATRLLCDAPELFDGVATVAAATNQTFRDCAGTKQVPFLVMHGTKDDTVLYDGEPGRFIGARDTTRLYARHEGCDPGDWEELERVDFLSPSNTTETVKERLAGCGPNVELWSLEDVGHAPFFDGRWTAATLAWLEERAP